MTQPAAPLHRAPMAGLRCSRAPRLFIVPRRIGHNYLFLLIFLLNTSMAIAQDARRGATTAYPARSVRLVVPFPPGGGNDTLTRAIAMQFSTSLGQPFVIDNRAGAGGAVGAEIVAKAAADGYTLLMGSTSLTVNASLIKNVPHDAIRDFAPVGFIGATAYLLAVHPALPVKSVADLIALAKARPGQLNYASGGIGSTLHLSAELFRSMSGVQLTHLPYKGGVLAVSAVIAGEAQLLFGSITTTVPAAKGNRVRPLAVTGARRSAVMPELPTIAETGLPGYESSNWYGVMAPARTAPAIIDLLNSELNKVLSVPAFRERMVTAQGIEPQTGTAAEFSAYIKSEVAKWARVIKQAGITPE